MPFERFTRERLESYLSLHPLSPQGRQFLESALEAPSRNAQGTTQNVVSDLPCPKMWGNAQAESWSSENPFTLSYIFDPDIIGYTNQVPKIELIYKGRNNRSVRSPYTGDCLCLSRRRGVVLEEWKPAGDRGRLEEKYPGKYQKLESGEYTSLPISSVVRPWGINFAVRFSDEITSTAHRNRRFLYSYLHPSAVKSYADKFLSLLSLFADAPFHSYADLLELGANQDVLNWAIATNHLHTDLDSALISTEPSKVLVFRHAETLKAWQVSIRPDGSRPTILASHVQQELRPGDVFMFDGRRLTVTMDGATAIYAIDERRQNVTIDLDLLRSAMRAGKVVLPNASQAKGASSRFWKASPVALSRAIKRFEILQKLGRGEPVDLEDQYSPSTIRRWRRAIREGETNGLGPVESLLDFGDEKGFRGSHIDPQLSALLTVWIEAALRDNKNSLTNTIYYDIKGKAEEAGYTMIVKSSFYERVAKIRSIKFIRDSQGHKVANQLEPVFWMLDHATPVHCERALQLVHFDSTLLDVELRSSLSGAVLGRPWLSIAVCAHTRRVVGMYLSFRPPSYVSTMMLLADIVRRFGRIPDEIIHDWGSEFKAKAWKDTITSLFITRHVRPKSSPRFGAILERIFGIVTRELIDNIAGNTKLRKDVRQVTPSADPSTHSGLWMADLYQGLEDYFFHIYDERKHPTTLRTPRDHFDASLITQGQRLHRIKRYDEILPILMPTARGRPRVIDPARGIFVNYRYYGHPLLANLSMEGTTTLVKPIPFDPGSVLAFLKGNWIICKSALSEEIERAPEYIRRCLFEEMLMEQRLASASHDDSRMKLRKLINSLNEKALENKEYWREREARDMLSIADFQAAETSKPEGTALARLDDMMKSALANAIHSDKVGVLI